MRSYILLTLSLILSIFLATVISQSDLNARGKVQNIENIDSQIKKRFQRYAEQRVDKFIKNYEEMNQKEDKTKRANQIFQDFVFNMKMLTNNPEAKEARDRLLLFLSQDKAFMNYGQEILDKNTKDRNKMGIRIEEQKKYLSALLQLKNQIK